MKYIFFLLVLFFLSSCNAGKYYFHKRINHDENYISVDNRLISETTEIVIDSNSILPSIPEVLVSISATSDKNEIIEESGHAEQMVNYENNVLDSQTIFNIDSVSIKKPSNKSNHINRETDKTIDPFSFFITLIAIFIGIMLVYGIVTNIYAILFALPTILLILGIGAVIIAAICGIGLLLVELEILGPHGESINGN